MRQILITIIAVLALLAPSSAFSQATPPIPPPTARDSSVTLAQIVERQEQNYARIRQAEGQVIWREEIAGQPPTTSSSRMIMFAFEGPRSVNLISAWNASGRLPAPNERTDWSRVLTAFFVDGDRVHKIGLKPGATVPSIESTLFNPAVHENNPLVAFHPRMLGEDRVRLRDLVELTPQMKTRPTVTSVSRNGRALLRVDFSNEKAPGEAITYLIAPDKGCLAEEISRLAGGRLASRSTITLAQTKDGTWIPARRIKQEFDANGRVPRRETWYYLHLGINEGLARKVLSFEFFHLPRETRLPVAPPPQAPPPAASPSPTHDSRLGPAPKPIGPLIRSVTPSQQLR